MQALTDRYAFATPADQARFIKLTSELRCLVCQNQTLAESNAPLAQDLQKEVVKLIKQNKSDSEIIHYMVQRYGNFVLFRPPFIKSTWLLWLFPFSLLMLGLIALLVFIKQRHAVSVIGEA